MTGAVEPLAALAVALLLMLAEAQRSRANERGLREAGAVEPSGDVYGLMLWSYPGAFVVMGLVAVWMDIGRLSGMGAVVFVAAKALKYWAISTLGQRWTFRVLVPPQSTRVTGGPYRWFAHPNYVAVAGELVGFALLVYAGWVGLAATLWFILLMWLRIKVEERALAR